MNETNLVPVWNVPPQISKQLGGIRTVMINGEPWFVGKDVCEAFGDTNHRRSLRSLAPDEKGVSQIITRGGKQSMTVINEAGLYSLLLSMQPQKAKGVSQNAEQVNARIEQLTAFRHWVTHDVLPSIRKYGVYFSEDYLVRWIRENYGMEL